MRLEITHPHYPTFSYHDWRAGALSWCRDVQPETLQLQDGSLSHDEGGSGTPDTELPDSDLKEPEAAHHELLVVQQQDNWADGFDAEEVYAASDEEPGPAQDAFLAEDDEAFGDDTEENDEVSVWEASSRWVCCHCGGVGNSTLRVCRPFRTSYRPGKRSSWQVPNAQLGHGDGA